jgi:hypothetical protein
MRENMRRFDSDENDEFQDELEHMFDFEFDDELTEKTNIINVLQLDLVEYDLNQRLLSIVIKMLEKSFMWKFRSLSSKQKAIREQYQAMLALVDREKKKDEVILLDEEDMIDEEEGDEDADL